ncbi:MAG: hypothetical protein K8F25_15380 [Fimbriimonadaceae bacterium]|nr:hypothetical protein [Alphaproteobacteria bacterium]
MRYPTIILFLLCGFVINANAADIESAYTRVNLEDCRVIAQDRESGSIAWMCEGYEGIELYVAEGDLRYFVSTGNDAGRRTAASETLEAFNRIHTTMEWRLERDHRGNWQPFATILRYYIDNDGLRAEESILVISKVGPDDSCHVARINASQNPNANILARRTADELARDFVCGSDQVVTIGAR